MRSVLKNAGMVSSDNQLIGLVAIILGFFVATKSSQPTPPAVSVADIQTGDPEIPLLKNLISQVQGFIKTSFKAPIIPKGLTTGGKTFPCRGPNCLGIFQARGTVSSFDPFTGQRLAIGGSTQFQNITGSNFALNQQRITQGNLLKSEVMSFLSDLQGQLKILQTKSV